jgi:beta-glucanase (GH16 family)
VQAAAPTSQPVAPTTQRHASLLPPGDWSLVWEDEFDYPDAKLDEAWESQNGPSGHILCSRWRENVRVENGMLRLLNRKEKRAGQDWTSGSIWTKRDFEYGYFECRYRYAAAAATNNSFWIMTRPGVTPEAPLKKFEIDINEGHYPSGVSTNIHNHTDVKEVDGRKWHPSSSRAYVFGIEAGRTLQLEAPVTTKKIRFESNNTSRFHVRELRAFAPTTAGQKYPDAYKPVPEGGPTDWARDPKTKVTVSGSYKAPKPDAPGADASVGGLTDNDPKTTWISQDAGQKWIELEFDQPQTIGCVQFLHGWFDSVSWRGLVNDYKLQYFDGTKWVEMTAYDATTGAYNFARDFHIFGLQWDKDELVFYVDGKEIRREKNTWCHGPAPVWLSLAIITWAGPVTDAIDGTFMEVDYVRVFEKKPAR